MSSKTRKISHRNVPNSNYYLKRLRDKLKGEIGNLNNAALLELTKHDEKLLENIETIHDVNEIILRMYDLAADESKTTRVLRKLKGFGEIANDWDVIYSSGNNLDCLIHSILTATCSNFRRLEQDDKNEFANFFRRKIFLNLPVVKCYEVVEEGPIFKELSNRIKGRDFLEDTELFLLAAQFQIRILSASSGRAAIGNQFYLVDGRAIKGILPEACCNWENDNDWPIICIYTNMAHFESVKVANTYYLTENQVNDALGTLNNNTNKWNCGACTLKNPRASIECAACGSAPVLAKSATPKKFKVVKPQITTPLEPTTTVKKFKIIKNPNPGMPFINPLKSKGGNRTRKSLRRKTAP